MKKTVKKILLSVVVLTLILSLFSCGDGFVKYSESGLNYKLPDYMKELEVSEAYADIAYGTLDGSSVEFTIYFYAAEELTTELFLSKDSTVRQYADWFVQLNEYENIEEEYDEEGKKIILRYVYEDGADSYFFYDYIIRNEFMLYHVTMSCNPEDRELYEATFDEWASMIYLDY